MNDLTAIVNHIIKGTFPELMDEDVRAKYAFLDGEVLRMRRVSPEGFYIEADTTLQDAPENVVEGGLAHELVHIVEDREDMGFSALRDIITYLMAPRYRRLTERNTDVGVIMRGYGRELLAFLQYYEQKGFPHYRGDGLSIREVEKLLQTSTNKNVN